jgi:hypothetical protein
MSLLCKTANRNCFNILNFDLICFTSRPVSYYWKMAVVISILLSNTRRQEENPLDPNNLPEEYGKRGVESSPTTATSSPNPASSKD